MSRPSFFLPVEMPRQYKHVFKEDDGVISTWTYDWNINPISGIIETNDEYPEGYKHINIGELIEEENKELPKTQRKYLNPINGKLVGYTRAKNLGLI